MTSKPHNSKLFRQIMRFAVVGGLSFVIDFTLLLVLTEYVGLNYLTSATISFIASVIVNYILSIAWVFTARKNVARTRTRSALEVVMFFVLAVCGLFINNGIMWVSVEVLAISYIIGKLFATAVVMVFNFITRKILIEGRLRHSHDHDQGQPAAPAADAAGPSVTDTSSTAASALETHSTAARDEQNRANP